MESTNPRSGMLFAVCTAVILLTSAVVGCAQDKPFPPPWAAPPCDKCLSQSIDLGRASSWQSAELRVPIQMPLEFSEVHLNSQNGGIRGGSYIVKNNSRSGLVTLVTFWRFQPDQSGSHDLTSTDVMDSWVSDSAFLRPGAEQRVDLNVSVFSGSGEVVRRVIGSVLYAEFDDGTRLGPGVGVIGPQLESQREKVLAAYKELLAKIRAGASTEDIRIFIQLTPELRHLPFVLARQGIDGLMGELTKPRALRP